MEMILVVYIICVAFLLLLLWAVRSDWKDLDKGKDRLQQEWDIYYAEARKYKKMKEVVVTYKDSFTKRYNATYISNNGTNVEIFNENDVLVSLIPMKEIVTIEIIREDVYTKGSRNLGDEW